MDVYDFAPESREDAPFNDAHETSERNEFGPAFAYSLDVARLGFAVYLGLKGRGADVVGSNAVASGTFKNRGVLDIGNHADNTCVQRVGFNRIDDRLAVAAAARSENSDFKRGVSCHGAPIEGCHSDSSYSIPL